MAKDKINEATDVASSRSSSRSRGKLEQDKTKQQHDTAQEIPEWAKNLPDEIVIKTWEID